MSDPTAVQVQSVVHGLMALCGLLYGLGAAWFATGMGRWRGMQTGPDAGELPSVSVVVAARDEESRIEACITGLQRQDYPADRLEIIVVDDGSRDATAARVQALGGERVRLLHTHRELGMSGSKKAALNLGIQAARGELILTTDADCRMGPRWIRALVAHFAPSVGMVVGFSQIWAGEGRRRWLAGYEAADFLALMGCIAGSVGHGHPLAASGQNLAYRRDVFFAVGGFSGLMDRGSGDDVLLLQRVRRRRTWKIAFAGEPAARVDHPPANGWAELMRKRVRWASNGPYQLLLDPLFFGYLLVSYLFNGMVLCLPLLWLGGAVSSGWAVVIGGGKVVAEIAVQARAMLGFQRLDLLRYVPLWILLQPLHVCAAGTLGCLGRFDWKGSRHRWGKRMC